MSTQTEAWVELARSLGADQFVADHPGFFWVTTEEPEGLTSPGDTKIVNVGTVSRRSSRRPLEIRWIKRADDNTDAERSVGRANTCDINFRHPSVSKLHARFSTKGERLTVTDLGSRNGTRVNGEKLGANKPALVTTHDRVQFGSVHGQIVRARELYELLSQTC